MTRLHLSKKNYTKDNMRAPKATCNDQDKTRQATRHDQNTMNIRPKQNDKSRHALDNQRRPKQQDNTETP